MGCTWAVGAGGPALPRAGIKDTLLLCPQEPLLLPLLAYGVRQTRAHSSD